MGGKRTAKRTLGNRTVGSAVFYHSDTAERHVGEPGEARTGKRNHTFNERNVVILRKIGTGKRTLANRIVGADIFQPSEHSDSEHSDRMQ